MRINTLLTKCFALVLMLGLSSFVLAQRTVTGTVTDGKDPVISGTVQVVGTTNGTTTDIDGKYSISVPEGSTQLKFTYIGYSDQIIDLGTSNVVNVTLLEGITTNEVVVVGYGTQTRKEVTSAVASVKAEDFNQGMVNNPAQLLQGKVAGLTIARPGGDVNGGFSIRLRGLSTIGANTQPLIIIDGIPGAALNSIDPQDIESIDVLKDGSASAIYGTRGSSGVILITTKSGVGGEPKVEYSGYVTSESVAKSVPVLSASGYKDLPGAVDLGATTDWFDQITQTGLNHVHNLSLSGGGNGTTYRVSMNYRDAEGIAINTGFKSLNTRLNLIQKALDDKLTLSFNLAATTSEAQFGFSEAFRYATIFKPTAPIRDESATQYDGYFQESLFDYFNPLAILEQNVNEGIRKRIVASFRADYALTDELNLGMFYSENHENDLAGRYIDKHSAWIPVEGRSNGIARRSTDLRFNKLFELTGNYETKFDQLGFKFLAGYSYQAFSDEGFSAEGDDFLTDAFTYNNLSQSGGFKAGNGIVTSYKSTSKLIAFFGRANLNYEDTYFFQGIYRREGSSRFGTNNQWGDFFGLSAGVELSKLMEAPEVNRLKLRASYGKTGALPGGNLLSLQRFAGDPDAAFYYNGSYVPSYGPVSNANPDLKWETKTDFNVGVDFAFMDYKLTGSLEYYNTVTEDMLLEVTVPVPPNLFGSTLVNIGELKNSGVELTLNYEAIKQENFSWNPTLTFATFKTELVSLSTGDFDFGDERLFSNLGSPGLNGTPLVRLKVGEPIGQIWAFDIDESDIVNDAGGWNLLDVDGDGTFCDCEDDKKVVGNGLPSFELGFNNSFSFGDIDFSFFLRGVFGHDLVNTFRAFYQNPNAVGSYNVLESSQELLDAGLTTNENRFSDYQVEDASFLKLDNATIGYSVNLPEGSDFSKLRVYVSGQNLFVITNYTGVDPEVRFSDPDGGGLVPGIDRRNTWYRTKAFTLGLQLGF